MDQTSLHAVHARSSARMAEFLGWKLPAQFSDPSDEHHAVRTAAGLFDVGFLGRIEVSGAGAARLLHALFTRPVESMPAGTALFGLFCDEQGLIIDTSLLLRLPEGRAGGRFLVTTTSSATAAVLARLRRHADGDAAVTDRTHELGQLALQGPHADAVLAAATGGAFKKLKDKRVREATVAGAACTISRTGFTGERGYELIAPAQDLPALWESLLAAGKGFGLLPCGMTCRDILRVEAGYPLFGVDIDGSRSPFAARLAPVIDLTKDFPGKDVLRAAKDHAAAELLVGFELFDKGIPRPGSTIFSESREIGTVTSGVHSPLRRRDIGLGYIISRYAQAGQEIEVEFKDREITARIVDLPFYRRK